MKPDIRMTRARIQLSRDERTRFYFSCSMKLRVESTSSIPTFATDGTRLLYNPEFLQTLDDEELLATVVHETEHCVMLHPYRRGSRDPYEWNVATDYSINNRMDAAGFKLPKGCLIDHQYDGMSAEQVYAKRASQGNPKPKGGAGKPDPSGNSVMWKCPTGDLQDAPPSNGGQGAPDPNGQPSKPANGDTPDTTQSQGMTAEDWKIAAEQAAMMARKAGNMPGDLERDMRNARKPATDCWQVLKEFIEHTQPSDYSWSQPNRRFIADNVYLPGVIKENTGIFVIGSDMSGSVDERLASAFGGHITAIFDEFKPERIYVVHHDHKVQRVQEFAPGDEIKLNPKGGGGTAFQPVFDWMAEHEIEAKAVIMLTDSYGPVPDNPPDCPVLWAIPTWVANVDEGFEAIGQVLKIDTDTN